MKLQEFIDRGRERFAAKREIEEQQKIDGEAAWLVARTDACEKAIAPALELLPVELHAFVKYNPSLASYHLVNGKHETVCYLKYIPNSDVKIYITPVSILFAAQKGLRIDDTDAEVGTRYYVVYDRGHLHEDPAMALAEAETFAADNKAMEDEAYRLTTESQVDVIEPVLPMTPYEEVKRLIQIGGANNIQEAGARSLLLIAKSLAELSKDGIAVHINE